MKIAILNTGLSNVHRYRAKLTTKTNWKYLSKQVGYKQGTGGKQLDGGGTRMMSPNTLRNIIPAQDNPKKCQWKECRAWKKKGSNYCSPKHAANDGAISPERARAYSSARLNDISIRRKRRKMASIRDLYREALGNNLANLFDQVGVDEEQRLNLSAEVDLSRVILLQTQKNASTVLTNDKSRPSAKEAALTAMRHAVTHHIGTVNSYIAIADKAAVATPERMKRYFEQLKEALVIQLIDSDDPVEGRKLFELVWSAIESVDVPRSDTSPVIKVEIL